MLKERYSTTKHIIGVDNDGADALSWLDILNKLINVIYWRKSFLKLSYSDRKIKEVEQNVYMVMCTMMSQCDFEVDEVDDEYIYPISAEQEFTDIQAVWSLCPYNKATPR